MQELQSWWEIAQLAGAGAAVVLGPACVVIWRTLWKRIQDDTVYVRELDKNTLKVLSELTSALSVGMRDHTAQHGQILEAVRLAETHIKDHIDANSGRTDGRRQA